MKSLLVFVLFGGMVFSQPVFRFIYDAAPYPSCHASTVVENPDGSLLTAWFGGKDEGAPDVAIWMSRFSNDAWSEPVEVAREPGISTYNPVLFYTRDGRLWLYYRFGPSPDRWSSARRYSTDQGKTWSVVEYLPSGLHGPIKNKPLVLAGGLVLAGYSHESSKTWASWIARSTDDGRTWAAVGPIPLTNEASLPRSGRARGTIQPAIVSIPRGRLRQFVRTTEGFIGVSDSSDQGRTWSPIQDSGLPNPNSGIDATTLKDGRIVLIYNDTKRGRSPLSVAISEPAGAWKKWLDLETEPGEFSYPAVIQARDGRVHVTYTWNRKKIRHVVLEVPTRVP
jgi:predicted neuraminidase